MGLKKGEKYFFRRKTSKSRFELDLSEKDVDYPKLNRKKSKFSFSLSRSKSTPRTYTSSSITSSCNDSPRISSSLFLSVIRKLVELNDIPVLEIGISTYRQENLDDEINLKDFLEAIFIMRKLAYEKENSIFECLIEQLEENHGVDKIQKPKYDSILWSIISNKSSLEIKSLHRHRVKKIYIKTLEYLVMSEDRRIFKTSCLGHNLWKYLSNFARNFGYDDFADELLEYSDN